METRMEISPSIRSGIAAGLLAGAVMAVVAMTNTWIVGLGLWLPMKSIAATFIGVEALLGGFFVNLTGILLHLANSAIFGAVFGALTKTMTSVAKATMAGLAYGAVIWGLTSFIILPLFNPVMFDRVAIMPGWWFSYHMVFGFVLGLTPALRNSVEIQSEFDEHQVRTAS